MLVFNIGRDDDPRSMLEIAERACELAGASKELIQIVPAPAMQTIVKRLSTARIRQLGWTPTIELEEGIEYVFEWVKHFDVNSVEHP
jgi:nucleoside-diphosphate-sugar epimerase